MILSNDINFSNYTTMKQLFRFSVLLLASILPATATAYDFEVDGIYYNIIGSNAIVTYKSYSFTQISDYAYTEQYISDYSGSVSIPLTVTNNDTTYSVTAIGDHAFISCTDLTSVTIPNSVTTIGNDAFSGCSGLTSVNIPNSITDIGSFAFSYCSGLDSIFIPSTVISVGSYAFERCSSLSSISIENPITTIIHSNSFDGTQWYYNQPNGVVYLGLIAYTYKGTMPTNTDVVLKDGTLSIANSAFYDLSGLRNITLPNTLKTIGSSAFSHCTNLRNVIIPDSVVSIGSYAFNYCARLSSVNIPNSVKSVGSGAYSDCSLISSVTIGDSVTSIEDCTFSGCRNLYNLSIGSSVTSIGNSAFSSCSSLKSIEIPNSVKTIGESAFYGCGLKNVTIPNSVTTISDMAFYWCTNLESISISDSVTSIGSYAFYNCNSMTSVSLGESVTAIGYGAFAICSGLTSITIPNSITSIGYAAFSECSGLTSVNITNIEAWLNISFENNNANPLTYAHHLYLNGSEVTDLTIPESITAINSSVFSGCTSLTRVTIPSFVTSIGSDAFVGCTGLNCVNINDITSWLNIRFDNNGANPLTYAHHLYLNGSEITDLVIPYSVTSIGNYVLSGCSGLTGLTIPNSVTTIGNSSFQDCSTLREITIPSSVSSIGSEAFLCCTGIASINIPDSVNFIGDSAFYGCTRLKDVYCYINDPSNVSLGSMTFWLLDSWRYALRTLYIPAGKFGAYQASDLYNYFGSFVEMDEGGKITAIELDKQAAVVIEGETLQLTAVITPEDATNKTVNWASSNPNVATVDENGLVTACSLGTTTITAVTTDGSNLSASCMVTVKCLSADNCFYLPDTTVFHGESVTIPVRLNNDQTILAFQTDIFLPEGFNIVMDEDDEYMISPSNRLTEDHILMANEGNGAVSVVCYTPEGRPIGGNSGDDLFYITVQVPENASGDYAIYLRNSRLTTADYTELRVPDVGAVVTVKSYIPGDANDSRTVTVTDIVVTAQYVLQMNPEPFVFEAADMNDDGEVTVTDIMLIAYLINHPTMNMPKRMPALDGGNDSMSGEDVTLMADETRTVSIMLDNEMDYTAFQLDLTLPAGLTASNFQLTDRAGNHASDVNTLTNGKTRVLCYSPAIEAIEGHEGALLTFDVTANCEIEGSIIVDGIELVTVACQTVLMNSFTIGVNSTTSVNELNGAKTVAGVDYFNLAGQQIDRPGSGVTLVVTTYTDGTRSTTKVIK